MKKILSILSIMFLIAFFVNPVESSNDIDNIFNNQFGFNQESISIQEPSSQEILWDNSLPDYFSWKDHNGYDWTTPAKNQLVPKNCGSCWIFAAIGVLESCIKISRNDPYMDIDLSEQYILSCLPAAAKHYGDGCLGGFSGDVFRYILSNSSEGNYCNGIIPESCLPYQADANFPCENKCEDWMDYLIPIYDWDSMRLLAANYIVKAKSKIIEMGPIATGMFYSNDFADWLNRNHDTEDYYPFEGYVTETNHAIMLLGWKDDPSIGKGGYWICKNSIGTSQGYDGFFNIEYDALNTCREGSWVSVGKPDLKCGGSISKSDITPGDKIYGNFTVENIGEFGSLLDWEIIEWPEWGNWTINKKNGDNLKIIDDSITIMVSVEVPDKEEQNFTGQIKIVNINDEEDYEIIDVSLATQKNIETKITFYNWLFENFPFVLRWV